MTSRSISQGSLKMFRSESGIDFAVREPWLELRPTGTSTEGRVYYIGPRETRGPLSVKLDLTGDEKVIRPPVFRQIAHPYPDSESGELGRVRCYEFDELFGEKIRAMGQRCRPRDLYDIVNLFRRNDLRMYPQEIRSALHEKCEHRGVPVPTAATFEDPELLAELESQWENMLRHQLPVLPLLQVFLDELPNLFGWIEGTLVFPELPAMASNEDDDESWSPPPTAAVWGWGRGLEAIRFAAANLLCVELTYQNRVRVIEPYSLRRSKSGNLNLHAIRCDSRGHRSYTVSEIQGVRVTTQPFKPVYAIEFSSRGPISAQRTPSRSSYATVGARRQRERMYVYQCRVCMRQFEHQTRNARLRAHRNSVGQPCRGRSAIYVGERWAT